MAEYLVPVLVGLAGLAVMAWPELGKLFKRILSKPASPIIPGNPEDEGELVFEVAEPVAHLAHLLELRRYLEGNTKALEVIDTILAPSIMKAGGAKHEGE